MTIYDAATGKTLTAIYVNQREEQHRNFLRQPHPAEGKEYACQRCGKLFPAPQASFVMDLGAICPACWGKR